MASLGAPRPCTGSTTSSCTEHVLIQEGSDVSVQVRSSFTDVDEGASAASYEGDRNSPNRKTGIYGIERQGHAGTGGISAINGVKRLCQGEAPLDGERPLPSRQRCDISDSNIKSAWARKTVLTLGSSSPPYFVVAELTGLRWRRCQGLLEPIDPKATHEAHRRY